MSTFGGRVLLIPDGALAMPLVVEALARLCDELTVWAMWTETPEDLRPPLGATLPECKPVFLMSAERNQRVAALVRAGAPFTAKSFALDVYGSEEKWARKLATARVYALRKRGRVRYLGGGVFEPIQKAAA